MDMTQPDPWSGWIPAHLSAQGGVPTVGWAYMGGERFTDPFCHITLHTLMRRPFNAMFFQRSGLDFLLQRAEQRPGLPLDGIIFHMSRCGSTLAAQCLAALPDSVVLSEPEPVDTLLNWLAPHPYDAHGELLQALLACMGQPRREGDRRLFLKTDCWHMGHIQRLLAAFPATPWVFLYRDPLEVLVSQQRMPGSQLIPGVLHPSFAVPAPDTPMAYQPLEYGARVLSRILDAAEYAMQTYPGGRLVNYCELPAALWTTVAGHFRLDPGPAELAAMEETCRRDAKEPFRPFAADSAEKQRDTSPYIRQLADRWLDAPYRRLEALRTEAG